jgi:hypothetical protein
MLDALQHGCHTSQKSFVPTLEILARLYGFFEELLGFLGCKSSVKRLLASLSLRVLVQILPLHFCEGFFKAFEIRLPGAKSKTFPRFNIRLIPFHFMRMFLVPLRITSKVVEAFLD